MDWRWSPAGGSPPLRPLFAMNRLVNEPTAGHVAHAAVVLGDPETAHGFGVPVGEEGHVAEVERLRPRDVRPRAVARDPERLHPRRLELVSPVTQEDHLVGSGARPVEEV